MSVIPWKTRSSHRFTKSHHINLQELRALAIDVRRYAREALLKLLRRSVRQVVLLDSAVCVGALGRCRSSSYKLNGILRCVPPYLVITRMTLASLWIPTDVNLADYPSRFKPVPLPSVHAPSWCKKALAFLCSSSRVGLELFAGSARLSDVCRRRGIEMLPAWDTNVDRDCFSTDLDLLWKTASLLFVGLLSPPVPVFDFKES